MPLTASHTFTSTGTVTLKCDTNGDGRVGEAKISAVQVQSVTQTPGSTGGLATIVTAPAAPVGAAPTSWRLGNT